MRTWVKATIGVVVLIAVAFMALMATGAYFVGRNMERHTSAEADADKEFEAIKARFGTRLPLIEIGNPVSTDIRINRPTDASTASVDTLHILNWKAENRELMRTAAPVWLLRFSSLNIASRLGLAPERFRLTVGDIQRYGPGIIVDYGKPGEFRVLVWVE
jgi:hypothetical protein